MMEIPERSIDLIEELNKAYPNTLPKNLNFTKEEIAFAMGQRNVIDNLIELLNREKNNKEESYVFS